MTLALPTLAQEKAIELLGRNIPAEIVASTIGVTPSAISQLLDIPEFASRVADRKYANTVKHTERDDKYDQIEDTLLDKLHDSVGYLMDPMKIQRVLQTVNQAKRRGFTDLTGGDKRAEVVTIQLPAIILQQFTTNGNNQVIKAGEQELVTIQSGNMAKMLAASQPKNLEITYDAEQERTRPSQAT